MGRQCEACDLGSRSMRAALLAVVLLLVSAPAVAAAMPVAADTPLILATEAEGEEGEGEGEEAPPTTAVSEGGIAPAELVPTDSTEPAEDQWTAKFLAPLVAILGALGVIAAFAAYGLRLRARYRVVE